MTKKTKSSGGNGIKIYSIIITLLLVAAIVLGVCAFTIPWVVPVTTPEIPEEEQGETDGSMLIEEEEINNGGMSLLATKLSTTDYAEYGVSPLAETAYTLTATITPSYATEKTVDWAVAFADPSSDWATGKTVTDYVTITPTSDGALTAMIECLQAFGEQIIVTCSLRNNAEFSATCTVDYAKRIVSAGFSELEESSIFALYRDGFGLGDATIALAKAFGTTMGVLLPPIISYSDYTVDDTFELTVTIDGNSDFEAYLTSGGVEGIEHYSSSNNLIPYLLEGLFTDYREYSSFYNIEDDDLALAYELATEYLADNPLFEVTVTYHGNYSDYEFSFLYYLREEAFFVSAEDLNLSDTSILF